MKITPYSDKLTFLVALIGNQNRTEAAAESGVDVAEVLKWLAQDPSFSRDVTEIESGNPRKDLTYSLRLHEFKDAMKVAGVNRVEVRI